MKVNKFIPLLLIFILILSACGRNNTSDSNESDGRLTVYTTVYPLYYFAKRIGGDAVQVHSIYPSGANEHTFEPTQKDMIALADADLFFYVGLGLEGFVENAKKTLKNEEVKMVATADWISDEMLEEGHSDDLEAEHDGEHGHEGHDHGSVDPHVWISPKLSLNLAAAIHESLVLQMPEKKEEFSKNYLELRKELEELDEKYREMARTAERKTFFVSHAAFGYIANEYGLEQVAIAGLNSQSEPSQKELTHIVDLAKQENIKYILFEQNVSSRIAEVIRKEVGAESLVLHNLGVLTPEDVKNKETYFTLMEQNLDVFSKALRK